MKNEDKIVDLLAEGIRKQDRLEETLNKKFDRLIEVSEGIMKALQKHDEKLDHMDIEVKNIAFLSKPDF